MIYALDTNTIIHILVGTPTVRERRDEAIAQGADLIIPPVVHYELRRGFRYKPAPAREAIYQSLCAHYYEGKTPPGVWECAATLYADLRRAGFTVGDADILIAAFCIENGYILVTDNTCHFEQVEGLQVVNWVER